MKNIIFLFLSVFLFSCKKDCKIINYSQDGGDVISLVEDNSSKLQGYILDEKGRINFNKVVLSSDLYEYSYNYDSKNRLKEIIKKRFITDRNNSLVLFVINTYSYKYIGSNPNSIVVNSNVIDKSVGYGENYSLTYYIEYEQNEIDSNDFSMKQLVKFTQKDIEGKGGYFLQEHLGQLPNRLIKSIVKTPLNEPSTKESYSYIKNDEDRIVGITNTIDGTENKPLVINYRFNYDCN